jgi:putative hydrolase of the HAD superfamily
MPIRAVLFDFGHTLVDFQRTEEALREAYEQIRARIEAVAYMEVHELLDLVERVAGGVDRLVEASYVERRMEELDIAELFRESLAGIGFVLPDDVLQHIVVLDHSAYSNSMHVDDETLDTLRELRARGLRLGIVSNMTLRADLMRQDLDRLGIGPLVDATTFSSETGVRKPDPRIFQTALERVGAGPSETVFVGDRLLDDVVGARGVGMRTVLTHRFRQEEDPDVVPDALIRSLGELPAVLSEWDGES